MNAERIDTASASWPFSCGSTAMPAALTASVRSPPSVTGSGARAMRSASRTKTTLRLASRTATYRPARESCAAGHRSIDVERQLRAEVHFPPRILLGAGERVRARKRVLAALAAMSTPPSMARGACPPVAPPATMLDCVAVPLRATFSPRLMTSTSVTLSTWARPGRTSRT